MVNVNTSNGKFNISESLFEAIKSNNPEILVEERKHSNIYNDLIDLVDNDKTKLSLFLNKINIITNSANNSNGVIDNDIKSAMNDIWNDYKEGKYDSVLSNLEDTKFKSMFKNRMNKLGGAYYKIENQNKNNFNSYTEKEDEIQQNIENTKNVVNENNGVELMKQCLSSKDLIKEIAYTENLSRLLVEKCKKLIQRELGVWGDSTISNKSQEVTPYNNPETGETEDINVKPYYNTNNTNNENGNTETAELKKYIGNKSKIGRRIKGETLLALGGFKFYPAFNTMANRDAAGKALKYYKSILETTNKSLIDNMIDIEIALKDGVYDKDIQGASDGQQIREKFETMVFNYLHNVVYNLDINNNEKYNNIIRVLSWDDKLKRDFNINNTANVQQFDVREQVIYYKRKADNIPTLLIIAKPLFAKGAALAKTAFDTFSRYKLNRN